MTAIDTVTVNTATADTDRSDRRPVWRAALVSGAAAAAAVTAVAAIARGADVDLAVGGEPIPLLGFAQLTLVGATVGILIAVACRRWSRRPRVAFVRVTAGLTALSIVPDVVADATAASRVVLGLTHVIAAAVIVPAIAPRRR